MLFGSKFLKSLDFTVATRRKRHLPTCDSPLLQLTEEAVAADGVKHEIAGIEFPKWLREKGRRVISAFARNPDIRPLLATRNIDDQVFFPKIIPKRNKLRIEIPGKNLTRSRFADGNLGVLIESPDRIYDLVVQLNAHWQGGLPRKYVHDASADRELPARYHLRRTLVPGVYQLFARLKQNDPVALLQRKHRLRQSASRWHFLRPLTRVNHERPD